MLPLTTIIIASGILFLSVAIVGKINGKMPKKALVSCFCLGVLIFGTGLVMHLRAPVLPARPRAVLPKPVERPTSQNLFTFSPNPAKWGQEVELRVGANAKSITVYLNGLPLPKKVNPEGNAVLVTIPANTKNGYFEVDYGGGRVRAAEQLVVLP